MQSLLPVAFATIALFQFPLGCWRSRHDVQHDVARKMLPAQLTSAPSPARSVRSISARVYVDEDYRAEILRWRERIEEQLERTNRMLEAQFGVRLEVGELRPWARSGQTRTLEAALEELAAMDDGAAVECVIGFVSFRGAIVGTPDRLGMARMFGRHLVVRNLVSSQEAACVERTLDALTEREREVLLRERERHREAVVLVHEWAHTLGAFHERDPDSIMSAMYATKAAAFSPTAARIIQLGLAQRASPGPVDGPAWARAYRTEVERSRGEAWDSATVEAILKAADELERELPAAPRRPSAAVDRAPRPATNPMGE